MNGTSMATAHVSAIAGLVLSRNSNLTLLQAVNIIESTAQKIGGYTYQTTTGRTNGTWINKMGYGLVNAFAAVQATCTLTNFVDQTVTTDTTVNGCDVNIQDVNVQNNAKLTIDVQNDAFINGPFEVQIGSELDIK